MNSPFSSTAIRGSCWGSTHGYENSAPGIGGSGVVLVRCLHADGSVTVHGWGLLQPDDVTLRRMLDEPAWLRNQGKYDAALALLDAYDPEELSVRVRAELLRAYAEIYAGQGREKEALGKFREANRVEKK